MTLQNKFSKAAALAAIREDFNTPNPDAPDDPKEDIVPTTSRRATGRPRNERQALDEAKQAFTDLAKNIGDKHNVSVIWQTPRISRKKNSAEYSFWKKPVMAFIESPETLDHGPTALQRIYAPTEANFEVTRDTFRAPLSRPARISAIKLLAYHGYDLKLPQNFSIDDVRKALKDRRDRATGVMKFKPVIEIVGMKVYCNGKSFAMQSAGNKRRIRVGDGWLTVEGLITFLSSQK